MRIGSIALALVGICLLFGGSGPAQDGSPGLSFFDVPQALAFHEFPLYDAGDRVDGLPLVAVLGRDDTADFVSFVYGDCTAGDDEGCAPPAEVQVWPACRRVSQWTGKRPTRYSLFLISLGTPTIIC